MALRKKFPDLYGATSTTDVMKLSQNSGEECICFWSRLKQAALDADLEIGPDTPVEGGDSQLSILC